MIEVLNDNLLINNPNIEHQPDVTIAEQQVFTEDDNDVYNIE